MAGSRTVTPELAALDNVTGVAVDLATPDGPAKLVSVAGPRVDILVNNVGSAPARTAGFLSVTEDEWQSTLTLNFLAAVRACRAVLPLMVTAQGGSIVTISSVNATLADPNVVDYSAAKAALSNFCKSCRRSSARTESASTRSVPVRSRQICGWARVAWPRPSPLDRANAGQVAAAAAAGSPTGRFSRPAEVAAAVLFLASAQADNINGADITIDGGLIPTWR